MNILYRQAKNQTTLDFWVDRPVHLKKINSGSAIYRVAQLEHFNEL